MISIEEFQAEVTDFLKANADGEGRRAALRLGRGPDKVAMFEERDRDAEQALLAAAQEWRAKRFDAGFGWITGPDEYGGRELPAAYQRAYDALESQYDVPNQSFFTIGLGMVAPTILAHGTDVGQGALPRAMYRGDIVACQLFSEPGAGSDLASLQTRAERDGEEWVITGQKVWTSGAQYSDIGEIIARTDPDLPKHKGLTGFIVDMRAPGRGDPPAAPDDRRRQLQRGVLQRGPGARRPPPRRRQQRLERRADDADERAGGDRRRRRRRAAAACSPGRSRWPRRSGWPTTRWCASSWPTSSSARGSTQYTNQRALDQIRAGQTPGPELSIAKLAGTQLSTRLADFVAGVLGPKLIADTGEWGTYAWSQLVLGTPGMRIAGGSDEVMRNIVGERVLGLPKDPGIDSTSPFRDLKVGTQTDHGSGDR